MEAPDFKTYYEAAITKIILSQSKDRYIEISGTK